MGFTLVLGGTKGHNLGYVQIDVAQFLPAGRSECHFPLYAVASQEQGVFSFVGGCDCGHRAGRLHILSCPVWDVV